MMGIFIVAHSLPVITHPSKIGSFYICRVFENVNETTTVVGFTLKCIPHPEPDPIESLTLSFCTESFFLLVSANFSIFL